MSTITNRLFCTWLAAGMVAIVGTTAVAEETKKDTVLPTEAKIDAKTDKTKPAKAKVDYANDDEMEEILESSDVIPEHANVEVETDLEAGRTDIDIETRIRERSEQDVAPKNVPDSVNVRKPVVVVPPQVEPRPLPAPDRELDRDARWRFKYHKDLWWYWTPENYWMMYQNGVWERHYAAPAAPGVYRKPVLGQEFTDGQYYSNPDGLRFYYQDGRHYYFDNEGRYYFDDNDQRIYDRRFEKVRAGAAIGGAVGEAIAGPEGARVGASVGAKIGAQE